MGCYAEGKNWRYEFQYRGHRYTRSGYKTKGEAIAAREAHRQECKTQIPDDTVSDPTFRDVGYEFLDDSRRRFCEKNWKGKVYIYKQFRGWYEKTFKFSGSLRLRDIDSLLVERYLGTLPCNSNFNRHRIALCSLFAWALKRRLMKP